MRETSAQLFVPTYGSDGAAAGHNQFPLLLSPFSIGPVKLRNRFVFQPHFTALGDLDGMPFADAAELGALLAVQPATSDCVVKNLYRYASGHIEQPLEQPVLDELSAALVEGGYDLPATIATLAQSDAFRFANLSPEDAP